MRFMMQGCVMAKGEVCDAGSKILRGFKAPFSATAYERCLGAGMEFVGHAAQDEFGVDGLFDVGEAQDASVAALLGGECDAVLCNDVFGKLRRQAPQHGLAYIHPAFGTVSRHGLIPSVSSMDQIGVLCRSLEGGLAVLSAISGPDGNDVACGDTSGGGASCGDGAVFGANTPFPEGGAPKGRGLEGKTPEDAAASAPTSVGLPKEIPVDASFPDGARRVEIELEYFGLLPQAFYILCSAELSANIARYDGISFGRRAEGVQGIDNIYIKSRTEGFGRDAKLAAIVGCMALSKDHYAELYHKAMQVRRLAHGYYFGVLEKTDAIALPTRLPGKTKFEQAALYALPSLCGFAAVALPYGGSGSGSGSGSGLGSVYGSGIQFVCKRGKEDAMFSLARVREGSI